MADRKITDLTALAAGSQATGDLLTIVDVSESAAADKNKKITVESLFQGIPGDVGIGTSSPSQKLQVTSGNILLDGTDQFIYLSNDADQWLSANSASNYMRFGAANQERMRITSSGNVGIGDSAPDFDLVIKGGGNTNENLFACKDSDGTKMVSVEQDSSGHGRLLVFDTSGNNDVLLHSNGNSFFNGGNTGFGTTSPNFKLDVNGEVGITEGQRLSWHDGDGARSAGIFGGSGDVLVFTTTSSNTERMRIDSSGNVGIGTSSPSELLHTVKASGTSRVRFEASASHSFARLVAGSTSYNSGVEFFSGTTNTANITAEGDGELVVEANGSERMRIDSSGNIGIGTSSPSHNLHINDSSAAFAKYESGSFAGYVGQKSSGILEIAQAQAGNITLLTNGSERTRITSDGDLLVGTDAPTEFSLSRGRLGVAVASNLGNMHGLKVYHENTSFSETGGGIVFTGCIRSASSAWMFNGFYSGNGSSAVASDKEFALRGDGNAYADGSWNGGGADYAEYFEWSDGNTSDEDRRGISVVLDGDKIREAVDGEEPIGVISGNPSVVGDSDIDRWKGKYLRDDYGTHLQQTHNVVKWTETITDEDGNESIKEHDYEDWNLPEGIVVPDDAVVSAVDDNGKPFTHRILNPDYNPDTAYISREDRPEWATVGLMGKLRIRKGQVTGTRWIKMRDVSDTVEEWLVR